MNSFLITQKRPKGEEFVFIKDQLYRTMGSWPLLKCVTLEEWKYILREIHKGICGSHIGINILVKKTMRYGYY